MTDPTSTVRAPIDLAGLKLAYERATAGEWQLQDGCSWRRIGTHFHDGDVLCPTSSRTDGHPDLIANDGKLYDNLRFIVTAHENWLPLLSEIESLRAALAEAEAFGWAKYEAWHKYGIAWNHLERVSQKELLARALKPLSSPNSVGDE